MVAPGAKGSFPSSTDDAAKPKSIIALSNPHENDWFPRNENAHGRPPGTKRPAHNVTSIVLRRTLNLFRKSLCCS
jgi:hypothetical protein